jgi:plasmid stability protein
VASITIRRLDATLIARLRARAASHGRTIEEQALEILRSNLQTEAPSPQLDLCSAIRRHVAHLGGIDLVLPRREPVRKPPKY